MSNTRATILSALASVGVVAGAWSAFSAANPSHATSTPKSTAAGTQEAASTSAASNAQGNTASTSAPSTSQATQATPTSAPSTSASKSGLKDGTYSGTSTHRYGDITVSVKVSGGKISDVTATATAEDRKSVRIDNTALPLLRQQALKAQSANIDGVSGATLTSTAYSSSLQKTLDDAQATT